MSAGRSLDRSELERRAAAVKLLVLDVDGVLTDGRLYYGDDGECLKVFDVHDGHGLRSVLRAGIAVAVVSGRSSRAARRRLEELGVTDVELGCDDKAAAMQGLLRRHGCDTAEVAAVGDDLPDLPMLELAGLAVAVADARPEVLRRVHWVTRAGGGRGAVRELCDLLLAAR